VPIDIIGAGLAVAPPSEIVGSAHGTYEIVQGTLDDLDSLPVMRGVDDLGLAQRVARGDHGATPWREMREGDGRNNALFRCLARVARRVDDIDQLLDYAETRNAELAEPMTPKQVEDTVQSVWKMQLEGRNRFGQHGAYVPLDLVKRLAIENPDALALLNVLKAHNGPNSTFPIDNAMAGPSISMGWRRFADARKLLVQLRLVQQVRPNTQHQAALYQWPRPQSGETDCG
jgi:hypothetical protein